MWFARASDLCLCPPPCWREMRADKFFLLVNYAFFICCFCCTGRAGHVFKKNWMAFVCHLRSPQFCFFCCVVGVPLSLFVACIFCAASGLIVWAWLFCFGFLIVVVRGGSRSVSLAPPCWREGGGGHVCFISGFVC